MVAFLKSIFAHVYIWFNISEPPPGILHKSVTSVSVNAQLPMSLLLGSLRPDAGYFHSMKLFRINDLGKKTLDSIMLTSSEEGFLHFLSGFHWDSRFYLVVLCVNKGSFARSGKPAWVTEWNRWGMVHSFTWAVLPERVNGPRFPSGENPKIG